MQIFDLSAEEFGFLSEPEKAVLRSNSLASSDQPRLMGASQRYIVGRQDEVQLFGKLLSGHTTYQLLNIYGLGGIGKSVVCQKLQTYALMHNIPVATINGYYPDLTPDRI